MTDKLRIVYWRDPLGTTFSDPEEEDDFLRDNLESYGINCSSFKAMDTPKALEERFDVLFFDWGGMSIGNDMLYHQCKYIIKHAEDHPNRFYIMVSEFTSMAMIDALKEMGNDYPPNIRVGNLFESLDWLKDLI